MEAFFCDQSNDAPRCRVGSILNHRDGRVLVAYGGKRSAGHSRPPQHRQQQDDEEPSVKFLMLNPSVHFDEIVGKVKAVFHVTGATFVWILV